MGKLTFGLLIFKLIPLVIFIIGIKNGTVKLKPLLNIADIVVTQKQIKGLRDFLLVEFQDNGNILLNPKKFSSYIQDTFENDTLGFVKRLNANKEKLFKFKLGEFISLSNSNDRVDFSKDAWGKKLQIDYAQNWKQFTIYSSGPDKKWGTSDEIGLSGIIEDGYKNPWYKHVKKRRPQLRPKRIGKRKKRANVHKVSRRDIIRKIRQKNKVKEYDYEGYDREGYNKEGYDRNGFDKDGFNNEGFDLDGYNRDGIHKSEIDPKPKTKPKIPKVETKINSEKNTNENVFVEPSASEIVEEDEQVDDADNYDEEENIDEELEEDEQEDELDEMDE